MLNISEFPPVKKILEFDWSVLISFRKSTSLSSLQGQFSEKEKEVSASFFFLLFRIFMTKKDNV